MIEGLSHLRLGAVGCGRVFERFHLPALDRSLGWRLVAVCDVSEARRRWIEQTEAAPTIFDSLAGLLAGSEIDALLVATPPELHAPQALDAFGHGLHVLVEKPMAVSVPEAEAMVEASRKAGTVLRVGFNRRFRRSYQLLKRRLRRLPTETVRGMHYDLTGGQEWQSVSDFRDDEDSPGGLLDDLASHQLDLLAWLTGRRVLQVRTRATRLADGRLRYVRYDVALGKSLVARCVASRGQRYRERLEVSLEGRRLVTHSTGVFEVRRAPEVAAAFRAWLQETLHLAVCKLARQPNVTVRSFAHQLDDFATAIRDPGARTEGADATSGLCSVVATCALKSSLGRAGSWEPVEE